MTVSSPTEALHALPNVSDANLKSNGIKAFGIARSVVQNNLSHGCWGTVSIHYKVHSTWTQSCPVLSCALFWLSRDGSWGTVGAQAIYKKNPYRSIIKFHISDIHASLPLLLYLTYWNTVKKLFWFWFSGNAEKLIKAKHMGKFWMVTTGCLVQSVWCKDQIWH